MIRIFLFLFSTVLLFSCVKQEFDAPPAEGKITNLTANKTIKELKASHVGGAFEFITEDWIIEATVVADDASGNYYKTIVIQDATAGIDVKLNANSLYNNYPEGRKVYIKLKGLYVGDYNGLIQLGGGISKDKNGNDQLSYIEELLIPTFLFKGERDQIVTPRRVKIGELTADMTSTLVTLTDVQFTDADSGQSYADAPKKLTLNRNVEDCDGLAILLRTSGYCSFANEKTPSGKGTMTGIYSVFRTDNQFYIRNTDDVKMTDTRCGGGTGGGTTVSIGSLRTAFANNQLTVPKGNKIVGSVISDKDGKNLQGQNMVVQGDDGKGIIVRFSGTPNFALGDLVEVNVGGGTLSEYAAALQVSAGSTSNCKKIGTLAVLPKKITLKEFESSFEDLESTLINIVDATASSTSKFSGSIDLTDASGGTAVMYTASTATFANTPLPNNVVNVVGIVSQFNNTKQIQVRNAADVTRGNGGGTGGGETQKTIGEIRALYTGTATKAPASTFIKGIVISDKDTKNLNGQNLAIQGSDGKGILVRFSAAHSFALGDEVKVIVSNQELSVFNELLQVNKVPIGNASKTGTGTITPAEVTIAQLIANFENYESTLVKVKNVTIPPAAAFTGAIKLNDGTGEIDLFTASAATFAGSVPPVGSKTITAIVTQYKAAATVGNGYQLQLRSESDIN
ncbi:MAG: DUF5689 domain-containing protein [Saprospiraceae bacterium]